jgi:hypothetical protein
MKNSPSSSDSARTYIVTIKKERGEERPRTEDDTKEIYGKRCRL